MLAVGAFRIFSLKSDHYKVDISDLQLQKLKQRQTLNDLFSMIFLVYD